MTWQSLSWNRERRLVRPWPPTPMMATFTLSLGATNLGPPRTWRGRIVAAATAEAAVVMNSRRVDPEVCFRLMEFPFRRARVLAGEDPGRSLLHSKGPAHDVRESSEPCARE